MATANDKLDRLFEELALLKTRRRTTYRAIADEFRVSVSTVKRDIYYLSRRFPIVTYCGREGGVELLDCKLKK